MKALQNPEQELRFTRSAQAIPCLLGAAVLGAVAVTMIATSYYRDVNPDLPHPTLAFLPLVPAWLLGRLAFRMSHHAYLLLTPLGLEIFPLFRPQSGMRVVYWQEIDEVEIDEALTRLTLHFDAEKTGGVHVSLRPIPRARRELLKHALEQRMTKGGGEEDRK